jgi:hypothetical protein
MLLLVSVSFFLCHSESKRLGGYQTALHHLVLREQIYFRKDSIPIPWLPRALCATEKMKGAHPSSVQTILSHGSNGFHLNGEKGFVTCAPFCQELLVFAKRNDGQEPSNVLNDGKIHLALVSVKPRIETVKSSVHIQNPLPIPFAPEIVHCPVRFDIWLLCHSKTNSHSAS